MSILCKGPCSSWLHRQCAGVRKAELQDALKNGSFCCFLCRISNSEAKISSLNTEIKILTLGLETLENQFRQLLKTNNQSTAHGTPKVVSTDIKPVNHERRYNFIIGGIPELPHGTLKKDRNQHDLEKIMDLVLELDPQISESSIRDHLRLGAYKPESKSPRRILVKLTRTSETFSILSKAGNVEPQFSIKADLSYPERKRNSALSKKKWELVKSGVEKAAIKIIGSQFLVNDEMLHSMMKVQVKFLTVARKFNKINLFSFKLS